ncbi:MAG: PBP1A family penicillin-binding protein [Desulfuromonadaceae bacterium]|nr:PBP1A family penicillin-binding protein [Desulfuromonas sp.]MDY0184929.1 PBP1A family penicillin-binding protein [Desulfuromonadaceae bacterium]
MFVKILRYIGITALAGTILGCSALIGAYFFISHSLPKLDKLEDYTPAVVTDVYSSDGHRIAEFYRERRIVVPVNRMPQMLIRAFVAAEDSSFFEHEGLDFISIFRAALKNVRAGGIVQGGSTITQQVAKSLLLTPERKFSRKFKEAILAWRIEQNFSKREILYLYLNQIYLGHGAYGVQAAAENYFATDVENLSLAQCSMLAGLPQAPSRYSPYSNFDGARKRQLYVLERMLVNEFINSYEKEQAQNEELYIHPRKDNTAAGTGYFTEQVRRYLEQEFGAEKLYTAGLQIHTSINLDMQQSAQEAVRKNLQAHTHRRGLRPPEHVIPEDQWDVAFTSVPEKLETGRVYPAILTGTDKNGALLVQYGNHIGSIARADMKWCEPFSIVPYVQYDASTDKTTTRGKTILALGSRIDILIKDAQTQPFKADYFQYPDAQGAMLVMDPHSGQVRAMVGGYDFNTSQFNRVTQARRQPGSAIKPLIYAAALDKGYTPASIIIDTPLIYQNTTEDGEKQEWKPDNYSNKFYGATTLREALAQSYNVISIKLLQQIGVRYAANYLRKLGIESDINMDLSMALGTNTVTPLELATAYSVFANGGIIISPSYIEKIYDRYGKVLKSTDPADFLTGPKQGQELIAPEKRRVMSEENAAIITNMLESVVQNGTGWRARALKRPAAGKTGTTDNLYDAWFVGYVPQLVTVSWVGYDQQRPLGNQETGSKAAAPAWVDFMLQACEKLPARYFHIPDTLEFHPVDPKSGLLVQEDSQNIYIEMFAPGTAPSTYSIDAQKNQATDFFRLN